MSLSLPARPASPAGIETAQLLELAEHIHGAVGAAGSVIVGVDGALDAEPDVVVFVPPPCFAHPADPLVGMRVPESWSAVGLVSGGRLRATEGHAAPGAVDPRVTITALAHRDGSFVSVISTDADAPQVMEDTPIGWVPDVLRRSLGLPATPPEESVASWVDSLWLNALAGPVLAHPGRRWTWRRLLELHPIGKDHPRATPAQIAVAIREFTATHSWSWTLEARRSIIGCGLEDLRSVAPAELGTPISQADWFDEGSMCRYQHLELAPGRLLLPDILAVLTPDVGDCVLTALADTPEPMEDPDGGTEPGQPCPGP